MPGPAPKPKERRQRANKRWGPKLVRQAQDAEFPEAPREFLNVTKIQWEAYWHSPLAEVVEVGTDLPAIHRYFWLLDEMERSRREFRKERLVEGSKGQPVMNPLAKQINAMASEARQLEDRLGLTPKSRAHLGVTLGEARKSLADLNAELGRDVEDAIEVLE